MVITAHWITKDWQLRVATLDFVDLGEKHTAVVIADAFEDVLHEWGLVDRCFGVTTDNAESNTAALRILAGQGHYGREEPIVAATMHFRCLAHILNLAVQRALGVDAVKGTTKAEKERVSELSLSAEHWESLTELVEFLDPFNSVTLAAEGSMYPTVSAVVPQFNELMDQLEGAYHDVQSPPTELRKQLINAALPLLKKYYYGSSDELVVATFLDPNYKLDYFNLPFWELSNPSIAGVVGEGSRAVSSVAPEEVLALVRQRWAPYKARADLAAAARAGVSTVTVGQMTGMGGGGMRAGSGGAGGDAMAKNPIKEHIQAMRASQDSRPRDDITIYLEEPPVDVCPLAYWRERKDLPSLQAMAMDYLAIPATSAPSERVFSQSRNLITWHRHRLSAERIRACMTLKTWVKSYPGVMLGGADAAAVLEELGVEGDEEEDYGELRA
ncbi:unnamed protein product [Closterium sp. NIES-65]|nr:unnamed protein product [Closterium sp. NIES-65]